MLFSITPCADCDCSCCNCESCRFPSRASHISMLAVKKTTPRWYDYLELLVNSIAPILDVVCGLTDYWPFVCQIFRKPILGSLQYIGLLFLVCTYFWQHRPELWYTVIYQTKNGRAKPSKSGCQRYSVKQRTAPSHTMLWYALICFDNAWSGWMLWPLVLARDSETHFCSFFAVGWVSTGTQHITLYACIKPPEKQKPAPHQEAH